MAKDINIMKDIFPQTAVYRFSCRAVRRVSYTNAESAPDQKATLMPQSPIEIIKCHISVPRRNTINAMTTDKSDMTSEGFLPFTSAK